MPGKSRVIVRRAEYDASLAAVVEEALETFRIDVARKTVLVKPNLLSARAPEKGVTTHPALVAAVVKALEKRSAAGIIIGDNSGMSRYGENEEVASRSGILDVARQYYRNIGLSPTRVQLHNPYAPEVAISREVLDCDVLISLPKFKTHTLTTLSCAIKNSYGFLLGAEKARLHRVAKTREAFARTVVDVYALRAPDLVICDGILAMQGNGPSSRDIFHLGRVLASDDAVALDATVGRMMGLEADRVLTTREAAARGLGNADAPAIEVDGDASAIPGFKLPSTITANWLFHMLAGVAGCLIVSEPRVDSNTCVRCGLCRDHCPTEAIKLDPYPAITRQKCIKCYCCLEFCPYEAMRLSPRVRFIRNLTR